jgi:hypothetical protein
VSKGVVRDNGVERRGLEENCYLCMALLSCIRHRRASELDDERCDPVGTGGSYAGQSVEFRFILVI